MLVIDISTNNTDSMEIAEKPASKIKIGDELIVRGTMQHNDLAVPEFIIKVSDLDWHDDGLITIFEDEATGEENRIFWKHGETVKFHRPGE